MSRKRKPPSQHPKGIGSVRRQRWKAELKAEKMIAEAARDRRLEMDSLWVQANSDPSWKPFSPSEAQTSRGEIPQRQHYIPRFWLQGFADPPTKAGKVSAVDLTGETRTSRVSTRRAATESRFYTLTGPDERPSPGLEDLLGHIENRAAPAFKRIASGSLGLSPVERLSVAFLLAAQIVRTPTHIRVNIQQAVNDIGRQIILQGQHLGVLPAMDGDFTVTSSDEYAVGAAFAGDALDSVALILFCRRWSLLNASVDSGGFVLPEHPVVMWSGADRDFYGHRGALNAHRILVPVSRQFLLVMHWTQCQDATASWRKWTRWRADSTKRWKQRKGGAASAIHELPAERVHALNAYMCAASVGKTVFCYPLDAQNVEEIRNSAGKRLPA